MVFAFTKVVYIKNEEFRFHNVVDRVALPQIAIDKKSLSPLLLSGFPSLLVRELDRNRNGHDGFGTNDFIPQNVLLMRSGPNIIRRQLLIGVNSLSNQLFQFPCVS